MAETCPDCNEEMVRVGFDEDHRVPVYRCGCTLPFTRPLDGQLGYEPTREALSLDLLIADAERRRAFELESLVATTRLLVRLRTKRRERRQHGR